MKRHNGRNFRGHVQGEQKTVRGVCGNNSVYSQSFFIIFGIQSTI